MSAKGQPRPREHPEKGAVEDELKPADETPAVRGAVAVYLDTLVGDWEANVYVAAIVGSLHKTLEFAAHKGKVPASDLSFERKGLETCRVAAVALTPLPNSRRALLGWSVAAKAWGAGREDGAATDLVKVIYGAKLRPGARRCDLLVEKRSEFDVYVKIDDFPLVLLVSRLLNLAVNATNASIKSRRKLGEIVNMILKESRITIQSLVDIVGGVVV